MESAINRRELIKQALEDFYEYIKDIPDDIFSREYGHRWYDEDWGIGRDWKEFGDDCLEVFILYPAFAVYDLFSGVGKAILKPTR